MLERKCDTEYVFLNKKRHYIFRKIGSIVCVRFWLKTTVLLT